MIDLSQARRVLAFFAHPDDETLGAGATLAKLARLGREVHVALAATGVMSRGGDGGAQQKIEALRTDAVRAMNKYGIAADHITFGDFPDNAMDSRPLLDVIRWLEGTIDAVAPDVVITHHLGCTNIDHRVCHEAAVVAVRPQPNRHIVLLSAEVPSSTYYRRPTAFEPNLYVAVEEADLRAKLEALAAYRSEVRAAPHPRSPEILRALAAVRGSEAGTAYAEAFMLIRGFA